ncbi:zinc ribbon domain-containing protein [Methanobrevibacter sp.]|uniref:zinc ribbon domain-containing protein n=1 Tax=Methanobrevibacter sp. TaxID=66852 RepID=UPI0025E713F2|nr:zinc ribbon domain-containing protein [Methanobrevibacter sp.]MBQ2962831.1 zinc ribbon domain-containing protein [Methanobrevibacter sp.]
MICPKCHTVNDDEEKYCRECGFQLNSARICPTCGKTNDSNSKYCKECGTVLTPVNTFRKQVIEENTKQSFFSLYKVPIICALVIILAIGAVTGMAYYNGGSGGDDGFSSIIPTDDNGFFNDDVSNDPTQAQMQEEDNKTNETNNQTNDTNASKALTEKIENKTNQTKNNTEVNKTKEQSNSSKSLNSSKDNSSKTLTEKVNKTDNKNKTDKSDNKNKISDSDKNDSGSSIVIPGISTNDSDDLIDDLDDLNDSEDNDLDDNDTDDLNDTDDDDLSDSPTEIEMTDVPNLAQKVSERNYDFTSIEYEGNEYTEAQCIDIFSQYLLNVDKNKNSSIEIRDIDEASNPSGEDLSQTIDKSDYLSMAQRVHSWIDQKDTVPNYVGISGIGAADLSPKMMLKMFTLATLEYSITEELPESVEI